MHMQQVGRTVVAIAAVAVLVAACVKPVPSPVPTRPTASPEASSSAPAPSGSSSASGLVASPSPSNGIELTIEVVAILGDPLEPTTQTATCDPEPIDTDSEAGETTIFCGDGMTDALRAFKKAGIGPIDRLSLQRAPCLSTPCSRDALDKVTVYGWVGDVASSASIDTREPFIRVRSPDAGAVWPRPNAAVPPATERPAIHGAPAEIASRTPYPFCGETGMDAPPEPGRCFRDAVLAGRPAELLESKFSTEGDPVDLVDRFGGHGPLIRYLFSDGKWIRQAGAMILEPSTGGWSFDPWPETTMTLPG